MHSIKRESDGLHLSSTSVFEPVESLTVTVHLNKYYNVFVHYQMTLQSNGYDFWSKLQITDAKTGSTFNAGSLVHSGTQRYKTASGYWMARLAPGYYTVEVWYKSPISISVSSNLDYQSAILELMWFDSSGLVSSGVKCYPEPTVINSYNILSPIRNLEAYIRTSGVTFAAYQLSIHSAYSNGRWFTTRMHINNQQERSTTMTKGRGEFLDHHGIWLKQLSSSDYYFGLTYMNSHQSYFEDCRNNYHGNQNLYVMTLPSRCRVIINHSPTTSFSFHTTGWQETDLYHSFSLGQSSHIIIRYQFSAPGHNTYTITRISIDGIPQKHTASISGETEYAASSGMWQGYLLNGLHNVTVEHRSGTTYTLYTNELYTRALDIVYCY